MKLRSKLLLGMGAVLLLQVVGSGGYTLATFYRLSAASSAAALQEEWRRARFWLEQLKHDLYSDVLFLRSRSLESDGSAGAVAALARSLAGRSRADRILLLDERHEVLWASGESPEGGGLERALLDPGKFRFPRNQFFVSTYGPGRPSLYLVTGTRLGADGARGLQLYLIVDVDKELVDRLRVEQGVSVAFFEGDRCIVSETPPFTCELNAEGVQALRIAGGPYRALARVLSADTAEPLSMVVVRSQLAETQYLREIVSTFLVAFVATLLASVLLAAGITSLVVRPFVRLNAWLRRAVVERAEASAEWVHSGSRDEVGFLADTFHSMVRRIIDEERIIREQWDRLVIAEKMSSLSLLAASLAHEMNNPLGSILSHVGYLKAVETDPEKQDSLRWIEQEASRMASILQRMREYARGGDGASNPEGRSADVNAVTRATLEVLRHDLERRGVQVDLRLEQRPLAARIGEEELKQVILNLLTNAAQAVTSGGNIAVRTEQRDGRVLLSVQDDGCGIPEENLKRVFDPFFTTRAAQGGTGLGLALAYRIVKHAGGDIRLASAVGRGTTIEVSLDADQRSDHR